MIFYQSRYLSQKMGINLAKWKRWSREFLPPDVLGGLQSGVARQFNLKDAFKVYLGGFLVSDLKFTIPEAVMIIADLSPFLKEHGFFDLNPYDQRRKAETMPRHVLYLFNPLPMQSAYVIRTVAASGPENDRFHETFVRVLIGTDEDPLLSGQAEAGHVIALTALYRKFLMQIE